MVYAAMSGGVDSSVAAALLKKQGYFVVGVFFKPWQPPQLTSLQANKLASWCSWQQDRQDAMQVCAKLGISFKTWDFSKEYEKEVVRYMINAYKAGITPNPDVMCNKEIKFGLFLKKALAEGADCIATGHYARVAYGDRRPTQNLRRLTQNFSITQRKVGVSQRLFQARDKNKDQSYFLWTLTQKQIKYCLFPIGDYTKPEVRKLAKKFGLLNWNKKDSQGVCFIGPLDMKGFLTNYIKPKTGKITLADSGRIIGTHDGVYYYTIGQRHGLNIGDGGGPYFVVGKDVKKNVIYVAKELPVDKPSNLVTINRAYTRFIVTTKYTKINKASWVGVKPKLPLNCEIKIRYRSESIPAIISRSDLAKRGLTSSNSVLIKFKTPARAVTPGQSAVFYKGEEVLGGGIIT